MTLATLPTFMVHPEMPRLGAAITQNSNGTLDGAGEYVSFVIQATEDMAISHFGFRTITVAGAPTADLRIETVDAATGLPTGALWAATTNIVTGALSSNTWLLSALTATASITKGQFFCAKILYNSGTSLQAAQSAPLNPVASVPYRVLNIGTPTIAGMTAAALIALGSSTTVFYKIYGFLPWSSTSIVTWGNGTDPEIRGLRFQIPFKARCQGLAIGPGSTGDFQMALYSDAGTELASSITAIDPEMRGPVSVLGHYVFDSGPVTLEPNTWYRATLEPTTVTTITLDKVTLPSEDYRSAWPWGTNAHYTTSGDSGATWTDTATDQIPLIRLLLDQLDDGTGSTVVSVNTMTSIHNSPGGMVPYGNI